METYMITEHFSMEEMTHSTTLDEYNRKHGTDLKNDPLDIDRVRLHHLCYQLEELRGMMECPLKISSGFRSPFLNKLVGGSATSLHKYGLAADVILPHDKMLEFAVQAMNLTFTQEVYLCYKPHGMLCSSWVHLGVSMDEVKKCRVGVDINGKAYYCIHNKQL